MKQISSKKTISDLNETGKPQVKSVELTSADMKLPEMKSPDVALVNRILNYSKSLAVVETESLGKVGNVLN